MPFANRTLLLIAACAPVLLAGCATSGTDTAATLSMLPPEVALPETVTTLPTQSSGEPVMAMSSFAGEGVQVASAAALAEVVAPAPSAARVREEQTASAAAVSPAPAVMKTAAKARPGQPPAAPAPQESGLVANAVAGAGDIFEAALMPASYLRLDDPRARIDNLIVKYAAVYDVPVDLVRRVVKRESNFNPTAFNRGHYGLMQIKHATARGMGYAGTAKGLFDAETNLRYAVKYLRGAYMVAGGNHDRADRLYQTGYYYHAKRMGLLDETGLGRDRVRKRKPQA